MKSFRPYWSRGRVPTRAGYVVVFAGVGASFLAYFAGAIVGVTIPSELHHPAAWMFLAFGIFVSLVVGLRMRRMGLRLSRKED
jgi:uncharacterized membrane protein YoaK (UPF0700 family)